MRYLLDTNILIYYLQKRKEAVEFLITNREECALSIIVYYEVLNFPYSEENAREVKYFLEAFPILDLSKTIVNQAFENRRRKKIKMADNFILATAQTHGLTIVTNNAKDFEGFVSVTNPIR